MACFPLMKAIVASLVLLVPSVGSAENAPDLLQKNVSFDGEDFTIAEMFQYLGEELDPAPNIVLKGKVGSQQVARLVVKDVPLGNLFKVMESVGNVRIEIIDEGGRAGPNDDPFAASPTRTLSGSGIVVVSSTLQEVAGTLLGSGGGVERPKNAVPGKMETEVISLARLEIPVDALVDAVKITWRGVDQTLEQRSTLVFHEPSKLLIVTGPEEAVELAGKTVGAVLPEYRERATPEPERLEKLPTSNPIFVPGKGQIQSSGKPKHLGIPLDPKLKDRTSPVLPDTRRKPSDDPFGR